MTTGTRPVRHKLPLLHRLAWILILIETTNAATIVYPALQAETTAATTDEKDPPNMTTSDGGNATTQRPAKPSALGVGDITSGETTSIVSTTSRPNVTLNKTVSDAVTSTKSTTASPVILVTSVKSTTESSLDQVTASEGTTASPFVQVTTTRLPSSQVATVKSTTGHPSDQVTEAPSGEVTTTTTTTESPSTSVTMPGSDAVTVSKTTTEPPFYQTTTRKPTERPVVLATTKKSTTERPDSHVSTLKSTTARPVTQVTTMKSTTRLPSSQVTSVKSPTGRPGIDATGTVTSEVGSSETTSESSSVTVTYAMTVLHSSTARPTVQLTTMKSTAESPSGQATTKKSSIDNQSSHVTSTVNSEMNTVKLTTKQPSTPVNETAGGDVTSATSSESPSVQATTGAIPTESPSITETEAVGTEAAAAESTTQRPHMNANDTVNSEEPAVESTSERPSFQATVAIGDGLTTTTSTTVRPDAQVTKAVSTTSTTEGGVIVDVILVTKPEPVASTTPPSHNLGDIVQGAVVAPQGSQAVEGGDSVVIEVVPILTGNATADTHSTFRPSLQEEKKRKKKRTGLKKLFTNRYMRTYVTKHCGVPNERMRRIVGGKVTALERYPWTVGIWTKYGQRPYCGGVIISWLFVLTAGHCTRNKVAHDLRVSFGLSEIDRDRVMTEQQEHLIDVAVIHQNSLFKDIVHGDDISVLKVSKPLQSGGYPVTPICIPEATGTQITTKDIVGTEGVVAGWGRTKYGGESSKQLREVWLPIVSNNACSEIFKDILKIREEMICAGDINGTKDACQGDSGGSLMWQSKADDRWYTLGVVSFGVKCAEPGYYGTYTRVQSYLDWICQVTDGLLCFGSSSNKSVTLPSMSTSDKKDKFPRERRSLYSTN